MIQNTELQTAPDIDLAADLSLGPGLSVYRDESPVEPSSDAGVATGFTWRSKQLYPFNSSRACLFGQHRLSVGAPPLQACVDDVDAFLADALRILWLCSHTPDDYQTLRSSPPDLQKVIDEWADAVPFDSVEAVVLGLRIFAESRQPAPAI